MDNKLGSRLELKFWNFTIQLLSLSLAGRNQMERLGRQLSHSQIISLGMVLGMTGAMGIATGYAFYYLASFWR
jgi:hypothetical protein